MTVKELLADLEPVIQGNCVFREKYKEELKLFAEKDADMDLTFYRELLAEIILQMDEIYERYEYLRRPVTETGRLERREDGMVCMNGRSIPLMTRFEVLVLDEDLGKKVWKRTTLHKSLSGGQPVLSWIDRELDINGLPARIRG